MPKKILSFAHAEKGFIGYLEGTQKSSNTVDSYRSDLNSFKMFLERSLAGKPVLLKDLRDRDLDQYSSFLKKSGLKNNTRRRKLLTVRRFIRFLVQRKKIDLADRLPTPYKVEKIPQTVDLKFVLKAIEGLPTKTELDARNRVLLWTLAETGCLVSELTRLRFENFSDQIFPSVSIEGKSTRCIEISKRLFDAVRELKKRSTGMPWLFLGYNKVRSLGFPISARGVELLVRAYSKRIGFFKLTPRTIRHSAVLHWNAHGKTQDEIQKRLGLKTKYAFRLYEPLFRSQSKSKTETTSNGETNPKEF